MRNEVTAIEATIDGKKTNIALMQDYANYLTVDYYLSAAMCRFDKGTVLLVLSSADKKVPRDKLIYMMDFYISELNLIIKGNIEIPHMDTDKLQMRINKEEKLKVIRLLKEDTSCISAIWGFDDIDIKKASTAFYIMIERFSKK